MEQNQKKVYFVSGIDTDVGKSYATGAIAKQWRREGLSVITQKFIQTGCGDNLDTISQDILTHRRVMGIDPLPEDLNHITCPIRLSYPASPSLAARLEGRNIDLELFDRSTAKLLEKYDRVLIEGAGGLMVPIEGEYTNLDYIEQRALPLILVTSAKLGSVNHTLLSLEACRVRRVKLTHLLFNHYPESAPEIMDDSRQLFRNYIARYYPEAEFIEIPQLIIE